MCFDRFVLFLKYFIKIYLKNSYRDFLTFRKDFMKKKNRKNLLRNKKGENFRFEPVRNEN